MYVHIITEFRVFNSHVAFVSSVCPRAHHVARRSRAWHAYAASACYLYGLDEVGGSSENRYGHVQASSAKCRRLPHDGVCVSGVSYVGDYGF